MACESLVEAHVALVTQSTELETFCRERGQLKVRGICGHVMRLRVDEGMCDNEVTVTHAGTAYYIDRDNNGYIVDNEQSRAFLTATGDKASDALKPYKHHMYLSLTNNDTVTFNGMFSDYEPLGRNKYTVKFTRYNIETESILRSPQKCRVVRHYRWLY